MQEYMKMGDIENYSNDVELSESSAEGKYSNQSEKMKSFHNNEHLEKCSVLLDLRHRQIPRLKPGCARFYDPVTKHYYKTSLIFETEPTNKVISTGIWYPENSLGYCTIRDARTGEYYKVDKTYDNGGNYKIRYHKMVYRPRKFPGSNYYKACYLLEDKS
ncbi:MAG: hypothetical protein QXW79_00180 [Thermoplasmata archaeon]